MTFQFQSDWNDLDAVVEYVRKLRDVPRVSLVGWSLGGPRAGGYASRNPDKVAKLVLLAPAYSRDSGQQPPQPNPGRGVAFNAQSHADFKANWDRQVGCANQYEPAAAAAVWRAMLESDPVGASWGQGVRRAPNTTVWGFGKAAVERMQTPTLMVAGRSDFLAPVETAQAPLFRLLGVPPEHKKHALFDGGHAPGHVRLDPAEDLVDFGSFFLCLRMDGGQNSDKDKRQQFHRLASHDPSMDGQHPPSSRRSLQHSVSGV